MEYWAIIAEDMISKQSARSLSAAGAPWSFSRRALWIRPVAESVVRCAEKPEFVWWPLPMPPAFCTQSASDQCHAIPHEHSPDTPNTALDACVPAKPSLDTLGLLPLSSCPLRRPALAIRAYWRGAITALNLLAPVQSCFSKLRARHICIRNPSLPSSAPHGKRYSSQALSNVRGRLRPTIE